ncbi:MAG TPA: MtnX-like HAD-IB family phosphatase [Anaerolineaceae bacterium]|nr:MtnX-like HAD-IB family phosphatase [Anaerolineaceae bacterium]
MSDRKVLVLSDFDGTITTTNTMDFLYETYATCGLKYVNEWNAGKLSTMEEERLSFDCIHASREQMEVAVLANIIMDPATGALLDYCRALGFGFVVLSEGQTWYIHHLLGSYGLVVDKVYGSEVTFHPDGTVSMEYPHFDPRFPMRGTAKAAIIENYQKAGCYTIFIGDGKSDTDAVRAADKVYAKSHLLEYCLSHKIPVEGFEDFKGLLQLWAEKSPAT